MGRNSEPIDLLIAKGRSHLTKKEILERRAAEIPVPVGDLSAPSFLTKKQKERFDWYADRLQQVGMKDLDVDCLARYIVAHDRYIEFTKKAAKTDIEIDAVVKYANLADKAFNQAHKCATALGLTITSRCKLTLPKSIAEEDDEL